MSGCSIAGITAAQMEKALTTGISFDRLSVEGFARIQESMSMAAPLLPAMTPPLHYMNANPSGSSPTISLNAGDQFL